MKCCPIHQSRPSCTSKSLAFRARTLCSCSGLRVSTDTGACPPRCRKTSTTRASTRESGFGAPVTSEMAATSVGRSTVQGRSNGKGGGFAALSGRGFDSGCARGTLPFYTLHHRARPGSGGTKAGTSIPSAWVASLASRRCALDGSPRSVTSKHDVQSCHNVCKRWHARQRCVSLDGSNLFRGWLARIGHKTAVQITDMELPMPRPDTHEGGGGAE